MLYTSYYAAYRRFPAGAKCVSISLDSGRLAKFNGQCYPALCPTRELLNHWHTHHDKEHYTKVFREQLAKLDPQKIANELGEGTILLCYEKLPDFCHRHLVAEWFRNAEIECKEL